MAMKKGYAEYLHLDSNGAYCQLSVETTPFSAGIKALENCLLALAVSSANQRQYLMP
jgi:hypothetical protein